MMYVSMFIAGSAVAARDVGVERLDSTPTSYSTITTVVLLQLSLALFLWAIFRDAEPKSDGPAEEKKPQMGKALSRTSSQNSTASTAESQTQDEKPVKPDLTVEVPTQAEPKPDLPSPYTSYQEKQLRQNPSVFYGFCVEYA